MPLQMMLARSCKGGLCYGEVGTGFMTEGKGEDMTWPCLLCPCLTSLRAGAGSSVLGLPFLILE